MKKTEAIILSEERVKLIIEYIIQILSDLEKVNGRMNFGFAKIDNQKMCVLDIYVPKRNFERHLNLGITNNHALVLFEQLLNALIDQFKDSETINLTGYYSIKSMQNNFSGINVENINGSEIAINFNTTDTLFMDLIKRYEEKLSSHEDSRLR